MRVLYQTMVLAALTLGSAPAWARGLECPSPQPAGGPGVLKETAQQMKETGTFLASSNDPNRVPEVAADLRARYPGVSDAELQNYLMAAYCPQVAKLNGLTRHEQDARMQRFAQQVAVLVRKP